MLERQDERILFELQRDGRMTNQRLAEDLGLSSSACWRRIKSLEETGVLLGYSAIVDREKAGFQMSAILHVSLERHDTKFVEEFVSRVIARPEVMECYATTGDADYHLRVVVKDINAYNIFLDDFMLRLPGIKFVRTNVILKEVKHSMSLPFRK